MLKRMTKLLGACAIVALATAAFVPSAAFAAESGTCGTCNWEIDDSGVFTVHAGTLDDDLNGWPSMDNVTRVVIAESVRTGRNCEGMFSAGDVSRIASMNLSGLNTSKATNMDFMFSSCSALFALNLSSFDTSHVTSMEGMFYGCESLTSLNVSTFDTSRVLNMQGMFSFCSNLTSLNVSSFNTSRVTNMVSMFSFCADLTSLNVSSFDTSNATQICSMFEHCESLKSLNLSSFNTSKARDISWMFRCCKSLTSLDLSSFDSSNLLYAEGMFEECSALKKVTMGSKFAFIRGSAAEGSPFFPKQSFANADGKWYDAKTHVGYKPSEVPSLTAATYYATTPSSRGIAPKKGQTWTAKSGNELFTVRVKSTAKKSRTVTIKKVKAVLTKTSSGTSPVRLASADDAESNAVGLMAESSVTQPAAMVTIPSTLALGDKTYYVVGLAPSIFKGSGIKTASVLATRVTAIPASCFENCKSLRTVTLAKNVKYIGARGFYGCKSLRTLRVKGSKVAASSVGKKAFSKTYKKMKVYAPKKKLKTYKSAFTARGLSKKAKFKRI